MAREKKPDLPGQNLEHISFLKLFQDGQNVDHLIGRMDVQHVAVIGAGYIGVEIAEAAIRRGKKVKLFDIADTSLASYYDEWFTKDMDRGQMPDHLILIFCIHVQVDHPIIQNLFHSHILKSPLYFIKY